MPRTDFAAEWRNRFLGPMTLTSEDVDAIMTECLDEGVYHDFKSGLELRDPKKAARTLREYIAGFANADGGFLVLGVTNGKPHAVDGVAATGSATLQEWAHDALRDLAPYLQPAARTHAVTYTGPALAPGAQAADVLIVAVARMPSLVSIVESGAPAYYLRIGSSTVAPPPYLITDLLLGRRARPALRMRDTTLHFEPRSLSTRGGAVIHAAAIGWHIDNESFVVAEDVRTGIVAWAPTALGAVTYLNATGVPRFMLNWIEPREPAAGTPYFQPGVDGWRLAHVHGGYLPQLHPFMPASISVGLHLPAFNGTGRLAVAAYAFPANGEPWWSEIRFEYTQGHVLARSLQADFVLGGDIEARPHEPPVVSWDFSSKP